MTSSFKKSERLCHRAIVDKVFAEGSSVKQFPFLLVFYQGPELNEPFQIAMSVPKRRVKHAVDRNRLKRKMREAFRLNKNQFIPQIKNPTAAVLVYMDQEDRPLVELERKICVLFERFVQDQGK